MARELLTVDEIMAILPDTPPRIASLTDGLSPAQLRASPEPRAWSVNDILAHLRASHDVLGGSILRILTEDGPSWRRLSPPAWMRKTDYLGWEFEPALAAFTKQRTELLAVAAPLPRKAWDQTAIVTESPARRSTAVPGSTAIGWPPMSGSTACRSPQSSAHWTPSRGPITSGGGPSSGAR